MSVAFTTTKSSEWWLRIAGGVDSVVPFSVRVINYTGTGSFYVLLARLSESELRDTPLGSDGPSHAPPVVDAPIFWGF